jgi:basic membrane protein A and related proteins
MDALDHVGDGMNTKMKVAVFFVGEVRDGGFNASALVGAEAAMADALADILVVSGVRYDQDEIRARLAEVVPEVDGLVFIGGQGNVATPEIAEQYPDKRFAIVQGQKTGSNLASYDIRQEDSAFWGGRLPRGRPNRGRSGICLVTGCHRVSKAARPLLRGSSMPIQTYRS